MAVSPSDIKTNKLNIYLIKERYKNEDSITRIADGGISKIQIANVGTFYYQKSSNYVPEWISTFFNNHSSIDPKDFFSSGTKAVLIVKVSHRSKERFFAIPFGSGRFLLKDSCYDERFGLITSLNILESTSIRGIDKRTLTTNPKNSREQIARASEAADFQIDFENDLVQSITGRSMDNSFGNMITGKEALSVNAKLDITNIKDFLKKCLTTYEKKDYMTNFNWIDQIKEVKTSSLLDQLNGKLLKAISASDDMVWLAVPTIIDWTDFKGFKYSTRKKDKLFEELELSDFITQNGLDSSITYEDLERTYVSCWGASDEEYSHKWNSYSCLNAEINIGSKKYFLSNSKWYEINKEFVALVDKEFNEIKYSDLKLPDYNHATEGEYNIAAAKTINALCLDAQNLQYGGGHSKIEFCDILTEKKELIHVKKYGGSAVLSHLFAQGFVSAELLLTDEAFRKNVTSKLLSGRYKKVIPTGRPKASDYKIVYAIIKRSKGKLSIPFFSKVILKNNRRILEAYGYTVLLSKIANIKVTDAVEEDD